MKNDELKERLISVLQEGAARGGIRRTCSYEKQRYGTILFTVMQDVTEVEIDFGVFADAIIAAGLTFDGEWKHNVGDILSKVVDVLLQNFKPIWTGAYTTCNARQLAEALFNEGLLSLSLNSLPSVAELTKKVRQLEEENAKYAGQILEAIKILQSSDGFKAQTAIHTAISILLGGKDKNLKKEVDYND